MMLFNKLFSFIYIYIYIYIYLGYTTFCQFLGKRGFSIGFSLFLSKMDFNLKKMCFLWKMNEYEMYEAGRGN